MGLFLTDVGQFMLGVPEFAVRGFLCHFRSLCLQHFHYAYGIVDGRNFEVKTS